MKKKTEKKEKEKESNGRRGRETARKRTSAIKPDYTIPCLSDSPQTC